MNVERLRENTCIAYKNHLSDCRQIEHSEGVAFDERKQTWMQFNKWMSKSCTHLWCFPRLITPTHVL